jgi:hypothetical protein
MRKVEKFFDATVCEYCMEDVGYVPDEVDGCYHCDDCIEYIKEQEEKGQTV